MRVERGFDKSDHICLNLIDFLLHYFNLVRANDYGSNPS
jgi:hypothetical protein